MQDVAVSGSPVRCPFCPCLFFSQADLDAHLRAFGNVSHLRLFHCTHLLAEVDGSNAGVDDHGEWHWSDRDFPSPNTVRACREFLSEKRAERKRRERDG